jgi:23S rRNA-/tRNA-specific pseudouridylate synthase
MDQSLSQCKLTLQASRSYHKKRKSDDAKKTYVCIVAEKITKLEIAYKNFNLKTIQSSKYFNE